MEKVTVEGADLAIEIGKKLIKILIKKSTFDAGMINAIIEDKN